MPTRPDGLVVVFVGDLHVGSTTGVAPKGYVTSRLQDDLLRHWQKNLARVKGAAKGKALVLMLGGDLIDGEHHHERAQTWGTTKEQRDGAVELLLPLANVAAEMWAVVGTEAHVGAGGEDDKTVAQELGVRPAHMRNWLPIEIGGRLLDWAHDGIRVSPRLHLRLNGLKEKATRAQELVYQGRLVRRPDVLIRHHAHVSPGPIVWHGITVDVCPCWQQPTDWVRQKNEYVWADLGVLVWWPEENRVEKWLYGEAGTEITASKY